MQARGLRQGLALATSFGVVSVLRKKSPARFERKQLLVPSTEFGGNVCACQTARAEWVCSKCSRLNKPGSHRCAYCGHSGGGNAVSHGASVATFEHAAKVHSSVKSELAAGVKDIDKIKVGNDSFPWFKRGFAAEEVHAHTFNADAIEKGSTLRAFRNVDLPGGCHTDPADIIIKDMKTGKVVQEVQVGISKSETYLQNKMAQPKYDGMQKVVPEGMKVKGATDRISVKGVESDPVQVADSSDYKEQLKATEPREIEAGGVAGKAALLGGACAFAGSAYRHYHDESMTTPEKVKGVVVDTAEGGMTAGLSAGAGAFATQIALEEGLKASSAAACGDVVSGTVIGAIQAGKAQYDYKQGKITKHQRDVQVATSATGTTAGVTFALAGKALCVGPAAATGPVAPLTFVACVATLAGGAQMAARFTTTKVMS